MPQQRRIPRFPMPALDLPPFPDLPAPGTPLPATRAKALHDSLLQFMAELFFATMAFREAWKAHYAQYGRPAPSLDLPARRRTGRSTPSHPDTDV